MWYIWTMFCSTLFISFFSVMHLSGTDSMSFIRSLVIILFLLIPASLFSTTLTPDLSIICRTIS